LPLAICCSSKSRLVLPSWFYLSGTGLPGQHPWGHKTVVVVVVVVAAAAAVVVVEIVVVEIVVVVVVVVVVR